MSTIPFTALPRGLAQTHTSWAALDRPGGLIWEVDRYGKPV